MHFVRMSVKNAKNKKQQINHPPRMLYLIKQLQYKLYIRLEAALEPTGLTSAQFRIMAALAQNSKTSSAELSRAFGVKPQTIFKQISILEQRELIRRSVAKHNKRVLEVELTQEGEEALALCDKYARDLEEELFVPLTDAEQALFRQFTMTLLKSLHDNEDSPR